MNRLMTTIDAGLTLLDRQVIDCDGRVVCQVDDVEISRPPGGEWTVTGLLGRRLPWRIPLSSVDRLDSAVHLSVPRKGMLRKQGSTPPGTARRRFAHLLDLKVICDGEEVGEVLDVRLEPDGGALRCVSLVVGLGHPDSMQGDDSSEKMGPAMLRKAIRWVHRHTGLVDLRDVRDINWVAGCITVRTHPRELTGS